MKITKRQLKRIIREEYNRIISEDRGARLTIYLKKMGDDLMIEVNETGEAYYPDDYPGFDEFLADMNDDLGYGPGLHQVNVIDYDDVGFEGNLEDAYDFVIRDIIYDEMERATTPEELEKEMYNYSER